jgi:hypothetical protein
LVFFCFKCVAENAAGKVFSHPSLVMVQKSVHEPRGLDLFKKPRSNEVELINAANPNEQAPAEVFVVLPSDRTEQVIHSSNTEDAT